MEMQDRSVLADADAALHASSQTLQDAIDVMATLIAVQKQGARGLEDLLRQQLQLLQSAVNSADQRVTRVVESALPRLTQLSQQALTQTLEPAAAHFTKQMADADQTLQQATQRYAKAQHTLETTTTRRMWIASIALLVSGVLSVVVAGYAADNTKAAIAEAAQRKSEIAYLDRVVRANLVPCGTDRLCAEVEKKGPRYGDRGQYWEVVLRNSASQ
ncbi:hypothetical protein [Xanthomonas floridensis]|uniref:Relaxation protein n=2 Tax=Xanthomonas floridensis TaxID=1843580 RepID=A0A1A9MFM1_9XANT|nr:hypothetical protein A7D17_13810 [Xanthomonas floridensis]